MNHFELFGLAPAVELDVAALEQKHRTLALELHPDRHAGADAHTRRVLAEKTAAINEALKVLKDPARRAFYLLKLKGVDLESESQAGRFKMAPVFLEEVLERREALDLARQAKDVTRAHALAVQVRERLAAALSAAQQSLAAPASDAGALESAATELGKVRYFTRYLEEVDAIEEEALSA